MAVTGQAVAYGHSSGLPPQEAPLVIAEKRKLFFTFLFISFLSVTGLPSWRLKHRPLTLYTKLRIMQSVRLQVPHS